MRHMCPLTGNACQEEDCKLSSNGTLCKLEILIDTMTQYYNREML